MRKGLKLLVGILLLFIVACGHKPTEENAQIALPTYSEKLGVENDVEFKILHVNDTHGRVVAGKYDGMGLARVSSLVKEIRAKDENVLFLDAGDTFHGTVFATLTKGDSIVKVMNAMNYDAMTTGNHDYNYGVDRLEELKPTMNFPIIVSNVESKEDGKKTFIPHIVKTLPNGAKVGIFGLATPESAYKTNPTNVEAIVFTNPIEAAKKEVIELKKEGVNYIVVLSHLGLDPSSVMTSERVAKEVEGIDLIVDGHSHTTLQEGMLVGETLIVQAGCYDKNLGEVSVTISKDGKLVQNAKLYSKEYAMANVKEDPAVTKIINEIKAEEEKITAEKVGETDVVLNGERESVRAGETNLGDLLTDAVLHKTRVDGVLMNGGGIRTSIELGEITKGDLVAVLPFGNYVVVKEITGEDLKKALENGVQSYPELRGAFPHIAGFKFKFDPEKEIGKKVYDVTFDDGSKLDLEKTYQIATNDFLANGGDQYITLKGKKTVNEYGTLEEILGEYIKEKGITRKEIDNRIMIQKEESEIINPVTNEAIDVDSDPTADKITDEAQDKEETKLEKEMRSSHNEETKEDKNVSGEEDIKKETK